MCYRFGRSLRRLALQAIVAGSPAAFGRLWLWQAAERSRATLNALGAAATSGQETGATPRRLRQAHTETREDEVWLVLLRESQRIERARQESLSMAPTGAELFE